MRRDDLEPLSESRAYRAVRTLRRWTETSVILSRLDAERTVAGLLGVLVLASVGSVFASNLGAGVKFLSFALLFVSLAVAVARFAEPSSD